MDVTGCEETKKKKQMEKDVKLDSDDEVLCSAIKKIIEGFF